jgi:hypothetical protein
VTKIDDFRNELLPILNGISRTRIPRENCFQTIGIEPKLLCFPNEIAPAYFRAIRILREKSNGLGKLISDDELKRKLVEFLMELKYVADQEKVKREIDKHIVILFDSLKKMKSEKYLFIIPIMNLRLEEDIKIGDSSLVNLNAQVLASLNSTYSLKFNFDGKVLPNIADELPRDNETPTFAVVIAEAPDGSKALELAMQKSETCLNVLRLYYFNSSVLLRDEYKKYLARRLVCINLDEKSYREETTAINIRNHFPTKIDKNTIDEMKKTDLPIINILLCKRTDELTPLQGDLLTAILWFGNAVKDEQRNMGFVKSMMALESLLVPDGGTRKRDVIAKRFASIKYSSGSDPQKKEAFLNMRNMYELRNLIIHSGEGYVYEDDLQQLMSWVRVTIQIVMHYAEKFSTLQELIEKEYPVNEALYEKL